MTGNAPVMLELGAYWAHYSMWFLKHFPNGKCYMVEPDKKNIRCGENNFRLNGYSGEFINAFVGDKGFKLDSFASERGLRSLDILHSDIQGYELEMLDGAASFLARHSAKYIFISTHSEHIHKNVIQRLTELGYVVEVESGFDNHTTSYDGFVFASAPSSAKILSGFKPLGRLEIARAKPVELIQAISSANPDLSLARALLQSIKKWL